MDDPNETTPEDENSPQGESMGDDTQDTGDDTNAVYVDSNSYPDTQDGDPVEGQFKGTISHDENGMACIKIAEIDGDPVKDPDENDDELNQAKGILGLTNTQPVPNAGNLNV